ncbi:MAG: flagellar motor protein MotB [Marmoricola sp.]|nr:flagellar motor protein MotB [Marmoricola sp.]
MKLPMRGHHRAMAISVLAVLALLNTGCAYPPQAEAGPTKGLAPAEATAFPDAGSASWREGSFPSLESLRVMRAGMGKDQVRGLLGSPHFSEGIVDVREWNYLFHFRTGGDASSVACQYLVQFDGNMRTQAMFWKDSACAGRVGGQVNPA